MAIVQISAIVLSYNGGDRLISSLESCKLQKYPYKDLVVADDCSTDNDYTCSVIENWLQQNSLYFSCVQFIKNPVNLGIVANLKNAAQHAKGEIIFPLGQGDACYSPKTFTLLAECIMKQRGAGWPDPFLWLGYYSSFNLTPKWHYVNHQVTTNCIASTMFQMKMIQTKQEQALSILLYGNYIGGASFVYSSDYFKEENFPLPPEIRDIEDYPTLLFMLIHKKRIGCLNLYLRLYECGFGVSFNPAFSKRMQSTYSAIFVWLQKLSSDNPKLQHSLELAKTSKIDPRSVQLSCDSVFYAKYIMLIQNIILALKSSRPFPPNFFENKNISSYSFSVSPIKLCSQALLADVCVEFFFTAACRTIQSIYITVGTYMRDNDSTINIEIFEAEANKPFWVGNIDCKKLLDNLPNRITNGSIHVIPNKSYRIRLYTTDATQNSSIIFYCDEGQSVSAETYTKINGQLQKSNLSIHMCYDNCLSD